MKYLQYFQCQRNKYDVLKKEVYSIDSNFHFMEVLLCFFFFGRNSFITPAVVCHHNNVPTTLILLYYDFGIWSKHSLCSSVAFWKLAQLTEQKMKFYSRLWNDSNMFSTSSLSLLVVLLPRKCWTKWTKGNHAIFH